MIEQVIDTNVLLFFLQNDRRLPGLAADLIEDANRISLVSIASLWEISIKISLGKLRYPNANSLDFPKQLEKQGFEIIPLSWRVMHHAGQLPWHHRDPFDRMLIAQALAEGLTLVTGDRLIGQYDVPIAW